MKVPHKMKSGNKLNSKRPLPEIFYITLLSLDNILKRYGARDAYTYNDHNDHEEIDFTLISSGIHFNLFSDYGVGKVLEPMIGEFMKNLQLDPHKYSDNIFYKEILRLTPEVLPLIREAISEEETKWSYSYAFKSLCNENDELEREYQERLGHMINKTKGEKCCCNFCVEFRKHHIKRSRHIEWYIIDVLKEIDRQVN